MQRSRSTPLWASVLMLAGGKLMLASGTLMFAGCAQEPVGVSQQSVIVPGDWNAPAETRAIAATQYVDVVNPPAVLPLGSCTSTDPWAGTCSHPACLRAHPGTTELDAYIRARWTYVRAGGTFSCRRNSNPASTAFLSVHSVGRAIDLMIPTIAGDADNTAGDAVANWLIENAEYIGIQRVIWDGMFWNGERGFSEISDERTSSGSYRTDHHVNHIHTELSVDGAARRTRFFTEGAPPVTCPVVCYGSAAVREDCSFVDCALTGEMCLPSPPRCGTPAPPEASEAVRNAGAALPAVAQVAALSRFNFVPSQRIFDTRTASESARLVRSDGATSGPLNGARTGTFSDWAGLPGGATSVWLNVTAVPLTAPGFVTAFAAGPMPSTSTLNFFPPHARANAAPVALGAGNGVTFFASTDVELIADWTGAFGSGGLGLQVAGPLRVLDTRSTGTPLVPGEPFAVEVGAPAAATGVVATVTVIGGATSGFLTAFPCGAPVPSSSNINFAATSVSGNTVISELSAGRVCLVSSQAVEAIVDVTGYLVPVGELSYQALAPTRLLDTRASTSLYSGRLGERQVIELPIQSLAGMPADVHAVVANLTAVSPGSRGFLTAFPCGTAVPGTSSLNFDPDSAAGALTISATGAGSLCLFASARTDVIVDVLGVWVPTPSAPPPTGPGMTDPDAPDDPRLDAGVDEDAGLVDDAAVPSDAATRSDAGARDAGRGGARPLESSGCDCSVALGTSGVGTSGAGTRRLAVFALIALGLVARRARRRRRSNAAVTR